MPIRFAIFVFAVFAAPAFGQQTVTIETCKIPAGELRLQAPTQIVCKGELQIDDAAVITRNGFALGIFAAKFNGGKARFLCFDKESDPQSAKCGDMSLNVYTLAGSPVIDTQGRNPGDLGGDVIISYASEERFSPTYQLGRAAGIIDLTVASK